MGRHLFDMEWNTKWDWDTNYGGFCPKPLESPKKMHQLSEWMAVDEGNVDASRSFNPPGGANVSNLNVSSSKSSISASTETSAKGGASNFKLTTFDDRQGNISKKWEVIASDVSGNSPPLEASVGSVEPSIALELGKRTFFDNSVRTQSLSAMSSSSPRPKKLKSSAAQNIPTPRCLVEGCNADLATAKEYHRKHRVCDSHSKSPKVIIRGLEHRFCQQCSRFHALSEFDEKKRSCRKRLSEHNARRRKPPAETIRFNSVGLSPSLYGSEGRQQTSFLLNSSLLLQNRGASPPPPFNSRFTITEGPSPKYNGSGVKAPQLFIDGLTMASKSNLHKVPSNPGSKGNLISSQFGADYGRALSLLSTTNSLPWISTGQQPPSDNHRAIVNLMQEDYGNSNATVNRQLMQTVTEGLASHSPTPPSEFWLSSSSRNQTNLRSNLIGSSDASLQENHMIGQPPYEPDFYSPTF